MQKGEEKRTFTTIDLVTVVSLAVAILSLGGAVIASVAMDSSVVQAQLAAERLARQLLLGGLEGYESEQDGRKLASLNLDQRLELLGSGGFLSRDPWGQPYSYRIRTDSQGRKVAIVWSNGPNRRKDSPDFITENESEVERIHFTDDDIGFALRR